eukprot:XP_017949885.1 PREDICTED: mucin-4-like [Xenopus tropicalis]
MESMKPSVTSFSESTNAATGTLTINTPSSSSTLSYTASPDLTSRMSAESSTNVISELSSANLFQNTSSEMITSTQPSSSQFQAASTLSVTESDTSRDYSPSTPEHLPSSADELSTVSAFAEQSTTATDMSMLSSSTISQSYPSQWRGSVPFSTDKHLVTTLTSTTESETPKSTSFSSLDYFTISPTKPSTDSNSPAEQSSVYISSALQSIGPSTTVAQGNTSDLTSSVSFPSLENTASTLSTPAQSEPSGTYSSSISQSSPSLWSSNVLFSTVEASTGSTSLAENSGTSSTSSRILTPNNTTTLPTTVTSVLTTTKPNNITSTNVTDKDIYQCLSSPCRNGATCTIMGNSFSCLCLPGYTGKLCQIDIDDCASNPCCNGGVCIDRVNNFSCQCQKGWQGNNCSQDMNECSLDSSNCDPNAECINTLGSYICNCKEGYKGNGINCKEIRLFPYGPATNDSKATKLSKDFSSPLISISIGFPFESAFYNKLFFTDNGVIIFQRNLYDTAYVLSYPYTSFESYDTFTPPVIAAFWADADFSGGIGELYYKVYDFHSSLSDKSFKNSLENAINVYFQSSLDKQFNALWALKITWENVPPCTSFYNTNRYWSTQSNYTNTYQAVLTTDGVYSFILILFEDGGMNWRYNALSTMHLPKMGYFSGIPSPKNTNNFPAFNDPQTEPSVSIEQRYTPDQFNGTNTGKKGQWAYRLDTNSQSNISPRLQCLEWYFKEPTFPSLNRAPSCPCTYRQAMYDPAFINGANLLKYGFKMKSLTEQYLSVQSGFPTPSGAGTRCYYRQTGSLLYGEKERFFPTPWTYFDFLKYLSNQNAYSEYFWNTALPPKRMQYLDGEIDPYNACCSYSGSDYLCSLYREKRPLDYCENYSPPQIGFFYGDPHINTLDGAQYTFNGLGEFILVNIKDENNNVVFTLQGRTARAENGTSKATNFVALAAYSSSGAQLQWTLISDTETSLMYNGTSLPLTENITSIDQLILEKREKQINAYFYGGISVSVSAQFGLLDFVVTLQPTYLNRTEGLLGLYNGDPSDDLLSADGHTLPYNAITKIKDSKIFAFGMTWKNTPENTIFTYNASVGESWFTYNNSFVPVFFDELLSASDMETINTANTTCEGDTNCLFDVLSTGNFDLGSSTRKSSIMFAEQRVVMENMPPNITGSAIIMASLNVETWVNYTTSNAIFTVETTSPDIKITENGSLIWSPTSSSPVFATLRANNSVAITELELTLILCNCSNNGTCNYDNPVLKNQRNNSKFMTATCGCLDAWTGEFCTDNLNACFENSCYNTSSCVDNPAPLQGYICSPCPKGLIGDGIKCFDIDECFENTSDCDQICINSFTGYNCSCNEGFTINSQNASQCEDIDECVSLLNPCGEDAVCTNKPGNYSCSCRDGYRGDPYLLCTDINECMNSSLNVCSNTSVCFNTNGSYHCECLSGFTGPNCTDIMPSTTIAIATTGINATTAQTTSEPINSYTTSSSSPLLITTTLEIMTSTSASNSENTSVLHTSTPAKSPGNFSSSTSSFVTTTVTASSQADHPKTEAPITPTSVQSSGGTSAHSSTVATIEIIPSNKVPMATTETTVTAAQTTSEPTNSFTTSSLSPSSITTTLEMKTNTSASTSENTSVLHTSTPAKTPGNFSSSTSSFVTTTVTASSQADHPKTEAPITPTSVQSSGGTSALSSTVATIEIIPSNKVPMATTETTVTAAQTTSEPTNSFTTSSLSPSSITTTLEMKTNTSASTSENTSVLHTSTPAKTPGNFSSSTSSFVTTTVTASSQADHPKTEAPITPTSVQSSGGTSALSSTVTTIEIIPSSIVPMATTETTVAAAQTTSEPTNSNTTSSLSPSSITTTLEMKTNTSASTSENTSVLHTSTLTNTSALKSTVMENFTSRTSSSVTTTVTVSSSLVTTTVAPITSTSIHSSGVTLALSSTVATTGALQTTTSSSTCMIVSCPSGFCSNGGTCSINVTTCTPSCMCPPMFTDDRCILAGNSFAPEPSREIVKRTVEINVWLKGENGSGLSISSDKYTRLQQDVQYTASLYLKELMAFDNISSVSFSNTDGKAQSHITSKFTYTNNRTIITFLNDNLIGSIVGEFNKHLTARRKRQIGVISFEQIYSENITSITKLSDDELKQYFVCNNTGFSGYVLEYSTAGFICVSPCNQNYCQNGGVCEHQQNGPVCRCGTFSIYSTNGDHCENLAINLSAFFGILFGSLAFLLVIIAVIILIVYCCRKKKQFECSNDVNFYWGLKQINSFTDLKETRLSGHPELKYWSGFDKVPITPQIKIQRPSLEMDLRLARE